MTTQETIHELQKFPSNSYVALYSFRGQPRLVSITQDGKVSGINIPTISCNKSLYVQLKEMMK